MQRFLIITTNCALLVLLLIGLPAATRSQLGGVQVSSAANFGALWLAYFGFVRGWFNFEWLKQALLWLQKQF